MQTGTNSNSTAAAAAVPAAPRVLHLGPLARAAQHKLSKGTAAAAVVVRPIVTSEGSPLLSTAKLSGPADVAASNHAMVNLLHKHSPGTDRKQHEDFVDEVAPGATDADPELTCSDDDNDQKEAKKKKKKKQKQQDKKKRKAKSDAPDEPDPKRQRFIPNGTQLAIKHHLADTTTDRDLLKQEGTKYLLGDRQTFNRSQVARVARECLAKIDQLKAEANKDAGANDHEECNKRIADAKYEWMCACKDRDDAEAGEKEKAAKLAELEKLVGELTKARQDIENAHKAQKDQFVAMIAASAASATVAGFASKKKDNDSPAASVPIAIAPAPPPLISFADQAMHVGVLIGRLEKLGGLINIGVERDKLREEHAKCASTIKEIQDKYDALSVSQRDSSHNVTRLANEKKNLSDSHNKLVNEHAKCADAVSKLRDEHNAAMIRVVADNKLFRDDISRLSMEKDDIGKKFAIAVSDLNGAESRYKLQQSDHNAKLVEKDAAHEKAINELNKQLEDLKASSKLQIDELTEKNGKLSTGNEGFATKLADAKSECSQWKNRATALASALANQKKTLDDASAILGRANVIAPVKRSKVASDHGDDDDALIDIASKDNDDESRLDPSDVSTAAIIPDSQPTEEQDPVKPVSSSTSTTASITSSNSASGPATTTTAVAPN